MSRLSRRLGDKKQVVRFSNKILDSLLNNMSHLRDAHSSGSLQAYFLILGRVKSLNSGKVALKVICNIQNLHLMAAALFEYCISNIILKLSSGIRM